MLELPCDGLASPIRGVVEILDSNHFVLFKQEINAGLMGHLVRM